MFLDQGSTRWHLSYKEEEEREEDGEYEWCEAGGKDRETKSKRGKINEDIKHRKGQRQACRYKDDEGKGKI